MNISKETKLKLAELLRADIERHQAEINRLQKDVTEILNGSISPTLFPVLAPSKKIDARITFRQAILNFLSDGLPKTSRDLLTEYVKLRGKDTSMPAFSSQLSPLVHKVRILKMHKEPNKPIESRIYYGLKEWFNGEELKKEYLEKINT